MLLGTSGEGFGNLGGTNGEEGGKFFLNPSHPIPKRKKTSPSRGHAKPSDQLQEISLSKIVGQHGFPLLVGVVELISSQFLHLFLSRIVCFGCLFLYGKPTTSSLPTPKVHFSNPDKQPKEITRYPGGEHPKLDSFFCDGQIVMSQHILRFHTHAPMDV